MIIWLTGMSGAGKTTLAGELCRLISPIGPVVLLDGDAVREAIGDGLGYSEADRVVQIGRLARLAKLLADQSVVVVVAAVYANTALLEWNRQNLPGYVEVHLAASLETLAGRDPKRLYARARAGKAQNVVGLDIPWVAPSRPDVTLDMDRPDSPERLARRVLAAIPQLSAALASGSRGTAA